MKRLRLIALLIAVMLCTSSCARLFAEPATLFEAPKISGDLRFVATALDDAVEGSYELVNPYSGTNRNACTAYDINSDGTDEYFVFYSLNNGIHLNYIAAYGDEWRSLSDITINASSIERLLFSDLCSDTGYEIIVGAPLYAESTNQLSVFVLENNKLTCTAQEKYTDFAVCNLTGDKKDQIFITEIGNTTPDNISDDAQGNIVTHYATSRLISFNSKNNTVTVLGNIKMDSDITSVSQVATTKISDDKYGIIVDSCKGTQLMITDVIYYDNSTLQSAFYVDSLGKTTATERKSTFISRDIDNDGYFEIPETYQFPQATNEDAEKIYYIIFKRYTSSSFERVVTGVLNNIDGYFITCPEQWLGSVTVVRDTATKSRTFYDWDFDNNTIGKPLFEIRVYSKSAWENGKTAGFYAITEDNSHVYAVSINMDNQSENSLSFDEIKENFKLIQ